MCEYFLFRQKQYARAYNKEEINKREVIFQLKKIVKIATGAGVSDMQTEGDSPKGLRCRRMNNYNSFVTRMDLYTQTIKII